MKAGGGHSIEQRRLLISPVPTTHVAAVAIFVPAECLEGRQNTSRISRRATGTGETDRRDAETRSVAVHAQGLCLHPIRPRAASTESRICYCQVGVAAAKSSRETKGGLQEQRGGYPTASRAAQPPRDGGRVDTVNRLEVVASEADPDRSKPD
jgi:hypothetical protein